MIETLLKRYHVLTSCEKDIREAVNRIANSYRKGGKLLLCGNGGSCADCDHIVGELMKGFLSKRSLEKAKIEQFEKNGLTDAEDFATHLQGALPAISLPSQTALLSAFANDVDPEFVYAQLVYGYAKPEDILLCLSTSGNSKNVVRACEMARAMGIPVISLTGEKESKLSALSAVTIRVPETETYKVQELHLPVYHCICAELESIFFEQK